MKRYSSEALTQALEAILAEHREQKTPDEIFDSDAFEEITGEWVLGAALLVKRMAVAGKDVELKGIAELAMVEVETLLIEHEGQIRWDRAETRRRRLEREQHEDRRWAEATGVSPSMLGRQLVPRVGGMKVNQLLAKLGLREQNGDRSWAFTKAGLQYKKTVLQDNGLAPGQREWTKEVLAVLQMELTDRDRSGVPS